MASNRLIEVRVNAQDQWYWHAKSPRNGKITFQGEGHPNKAKALRAIEQELNALGASKAVDVHVFKEVDDTKPAEKFLMHWMTDGTIQRLELVNRDKAAPDAPVAKTPLRTKVTAGPRVVKDLDEVGAIAARSAKTFLANAKDPAPVKKAITTRERAVVAKKVTGKK